MQFMNYKCFHRATENSQFWSADNPVTRRKTLELYISANHGRRLMSMFLNQTSVSLYHHIALAETRNAWNNCLGVGKKISKNHGKDCENNATTIKQIKTTALWRLSYVMLRNKHKLNVPMGNDAISWKSRVSIDLSITSPTCPLWTFSHFIIVAIPCYFSITHAYWTTEIKLQECQGTLLLYFCC